MNRIELMGRFFDSTGHQARFLGVTERTLYRWRKDPSNLDGAALRLVWILENLEMTAPEFHAALVEQARTKQVSH